MNRKSFLKSGLVLCSILSFSASIESDKLKKANALMDVPGKKPVMVTVDQSNPDKVILNYKVPEAEIIELTEKYDNTELKRITLGMLLFHGTKENQYYRLFLLSLLFRQENQLHLSIYRGTEKKYCQAGISLNSAKLLFL